MRRRIAILVVVAIGPITEADQYIDWSNNLLDQNRHPGQVSK